jgi:Secretion system C-terminal sorting domain
MKRIITILLFSFLTITAQPYQISYSVIIDNCEQTSSLEIMNGTMNEGESFIFPAFTFPIEYISAQFLYNIFVGAEFGIPVGALKENISIEINLGNFWCDLSILEQPEGVFRLFSLFVEITGENSGHNPDNYYWFEQNKEGFIKINMDKISYFLTLLQIDDPNDIEVFYVNGDSIDREAIRKEIVDNKFIIYPKHYSLLSGGIISDVTDVENSLLKLPSEYNLEQNYPNPFNPTTTISYSLLNAGYTHLSIYNLIGEEIEVLVNENQSEGFYSISFNAADLPSGLYFYTLSSGNFNKTSKMIIMK